MDSRLDFFVIAVEVVDDDDVADNDDDIADDEEDGAFVSASFDGSIALL